MNQNQVSSWREKVKLILQHHFFGFVALYLGVFDSKWAGIKYGEHTNKNLTYFWPIGGPKRPKNGKWDSKTYFTPPSNETLSHSNGKDVFDHGPYLFIISSKNSKVWNQIWMMNWINITKFNMIRSWWKLFLRMLSISLFRNLLLHEQIVKFYVQVSILVPH